MAAFRSIGKLREIMAKKLNLSDPQVAALMRQHKKLVPWRSASYDDEATLFELRSANLKTDWNQITRMFNKTVPYKRRRSMDGIKNKWKSIKSKSHKASEVTRIESPAEYFTTLQTASAMQMIPEAPLESEYNQKMSIASQAAPAVDSTYYAHMNNEYDTTIDDQFSVSFDTLNEYLAECSEMVSTHWDSVASLDGHVASVTDEPERLETAKMLTVEAASDRTVVGEECIYQK